MRRLANPELTLSPLTGLVVMDEIQRRPELFPALRPLLDRPGAPVRFLLLGSASFRLARGASESLAGRIGFCDLTGFGLDETAEGADWRTLWERGGFPRSFLQPDLPSSVRWREDFVRTFFERDLSALGIRVPPEALRSFFRMIAHYHGQVWNAREFARAIGRGEAAARRHLDLLVGAFIVRALPSWFENLKKRQVRAPKIYVRDSGLLHSLLDIPSLHTLSGHPKIGASFEGFAIEQILAALSVREACVWGTHGGAELDLLVFRNARRYGFEIQYTDAPRTTRSMRIAISDLGLARLFVVYPGEDRYLLDDSIEALPIGSIPVLARRPEFVVA